MSKPQDVCAHPGLMHPDLALPLLLEQVTPLEDTETVQLSNSLGRVLAEDLASSIDLPPFDNSAMDGYAYRYADLPEKASLKLLGSSFAGHPFEGQYQPGGCVRIMTGAPVPAGFDTVQMQEKTEAYGELITIEPCKQAGDNVRGRGEELLAGTKVLRPAL